jgi:hypothetical protein
LGVEQKRRHGIVVAGRVKGVFGPIAASAATATEIGSATFS